MKALYFDCFSGASGDMILAALLDAGAPEGRVRENLETLGLSGWSLDVMQVQRGGLRSTRAEVRIEEDFPPRTHQEIVSVLDAAPIAASVREQATAVFALLADAEGRIHGKSPRDVHFHEVGGLDAIVDIVACCTALNHFLPAHIVTSPITTGTGIVRTAHGMLPLPPPAVTEILQARGATLVARGEEELITPTGAALLATFSGRFGPMPSMKLSTTGYGAGAADRVAPNVLRVLVGELPDDASSPTVDALLIETNLDDINPELLPYIVDSLLDAGAYDAWVTPIVMKKGRPGFSMSVLCDPIKRWHVMEIIFRESTTLGVRIGSVQREVAQRRWSDVEVGGETIRVKIGSRNGDVIMVAPEFDDVLAAARSTGLPMKEIYARALRQASAQMGLEG
ncbi:MAG: nickel pincer cofactor biosynthesis protein LarC [Actinomycetota bacterium]|nr:nickel pincer cofactor biosynthesis protein LarC [Actinomycetota bacterium]